MNSSTFTVYNASAGSGKTFTLVFNYLKILLAHQSNNHYRNFLALTFTNKAVGEMKQRILSTLAELKNHRIENQPTPMFGMLKEALGFTDEVLIKKASDVLESLLFNYAAFDVSTIDKFNQRLVRTFSRDLNLTQSFEITLEIDELIKQAIDNVIAIAGTDEKLTALLIDFSLSKVDEDRSFNIENDLFNIARLIKNETHFAHLNQIKQHSLDDFLKLRKAVDKEIKLIESEIKSIGEKGLAIIDENHVPYNHFSGGGDLPNHLKKLANINIANIKFDGRLQNSIDKATYVSAKADERSIATINNIIQELLALYENSKNIDYIRLSMLIAIKKNLVPVMVLNEIYKQLELIKEAQNILPLSEFNEIINTHIASQPAPFIYERIGERYKHYFIDEFQDTSKLQWKNLAPLTCNALASENASLLLVGDPKQAIYQWRGGEVEQFIDLINKKENPCVVEADVYNLQYNRRSCKAVIVFNNQFFTSIATVALSNNDYAKLFKEAEQKTWIEEDGYVSIEFIQGENVEERNERHCEASLERIRKCLKVGYKPYQICVLVRTNTQGALVANYISENSDYKVVSSDSLLLNQSEKVAFIIHYLQLLIDETNEEAKVAVLDYIAKSYLKQDHSHQFIAAFIKEPLNTLYEYLVQKSDHKDFAIHADLPLYSLIEQLIYVYDLAPTSDVYLSTFLELVLEVSNSIDTSIQGLLNAYFDKIDKRSIVSSLAEDTIQIMTIHKAKGLEFPVVLFPFADTQLVDHKKMPKVWFPLSKILDSSISHSLINVSKEMETWGEPASSMYKDVYARKELDALNVLYVALTRAVEQLHIISSIDLKKENPENQATYAGLFVHYLKNSGFWNPSNYFYEFGAIDSAYGHEAFKNYSKQYDSYFTTPLSELNINIHTKKGQLWNTKQQEAIEKGNLVHAILAQIKTVADLDFVLNDFIRSGELPFSERNNIKEVLMTLFNHKELSQYYSSDYEVYNEREIISSQNQILIPDRVVIKENQATIIDYKTGTSNPNHEMQLNAYREQLEAMGFKVNALILVYISDEISIKKIAI